MSDPDDFEVAEERLMSVFTYASTSGDYTTIYTVELDSLLEERDALRAERDAARDAIRGYFRANGLHIASDGEWSSSVGYDVMLREYLESIGEKAPKHDANPFDEHGNYRGNALSQDTESPRPANCDCGCSPPGPGLHYANCPAATADDTESPEEPRCPACGWPDPWQNGEDPTCTHPFHQSDTESPEGT